MILQVKVQRNDYRLQKNENRSSWTTSGTVSNKSCQLLQITGCVDQ
jgi:hypothetical protein